MSVFMTTKWTFSEYVCLRICRLHCFCSMEWIKVLYWFPIITYNKHWLSLFRSHNLISCFYWKKAPILDTVVVVVAVVVFTVVAVVIFIVVIFVVDDYPHSCSSSFDNLYLLQILRSGFDPGFCKKTFWYRLENWLYSWFRLIQVMLEQKLVLIQIDTSDARTETCLYPDLGDDSGSEP